MVIQYDAVIYVDVGTSAWISIDGNLKKTGVVSSANSHTGTFRTRNSFYAPSPKAVAPYFHLY